LVTSREILTTFVFSVAFRPDSGTRSSFMGLPDDTHWTYHTRENTFGRVIRPTQRPVPDNTQH